MAKDSGIKRLGLKIALFIAGFTTVYVLLGVSVALVGSFLKVNMGWLFVMAGLILIVFGLHVMRVFRIPWLEGTWGGMDKAKEARDLMGCFLVGVAFAVGWSPCTGPIVAAILALAANRGTVWEGGLLLLLYCAGLGIPFLLTGLAVHKFLSLFARVQRYMRVVEISAGILLILLGILFLTQHANLLRSLFGGWTGISAEMWEMKRVQAINQGIGIVAMGAAFAAGLISFISPCVLPLLPSYIAFIAGTDDLDELLGEKEEEAD